MAPRPRSKSVAVREQTGSVEEEAVVRVAGCMHHWVIDMPSGPFSTGTCRVCGEKKQFQNYLENSYWGADISLEQLAAKAGVSGGRGSSKPTSNSNEEN